MRTYLGRTTMNWDTWFIVFNDGQLRLSERKGTTTRLDKLVYKLDELAVKAIVDIPKKLKSQLICKGVDFYNKY